MLELYGASSAYPRRIEFRMGKWLAEPHRLVGNSWSCSSDSRVESLLDCLLHICSATGHASLCHWLFSVSDTCICVMAIVMIRLIYIESLLYAKQWAEGFRLWCFKSSQCCKSSIIIFILQTRIQIREAKSMVPLPALKKLEYLEQQKK